jgi:plastocyanin
VKRFVLGLALVGLAALTAACTSGGGGATPGPTSAPVSVPAGGSIVIVAKDNVFLTTSVSAPADEPFEIVLDNQDGAPHNIAISDASGASVFKGEIVSNTKVTNAIPALAAGTYSFICDVHTDMKGTITAE